MADLMQISIQGVPAYAFFAMLVAFWILGMMLTRGTVQREGPHALRSPVVSLPVRREAPAASGSSTPERKLAA